MDTDLQGLMLRLRKRDRVELGEYGIDPDEAVSMLSAPSALTRLFHACGAPQAVIAFHAITPRTLSASLLATDEWPRVIRPVWRWCVQVARPTLLAQGFTRAECRTMQGHDDAIRFLEKLGFRAECHIPHFGATGAAFTQYAWRLQDNVPDENTKNAGPAATATP